MTESGHPVEVEKFVKANDYYQCRNISENDRINSNAEKHQTDDYKVVYMFYPGFPFYLRFFSSVYKINPNCSEQVVNKNYSIYDPNRFHEFICN